MGQIEPIALTEASYEARSVLAGAQRCVNLYPEMNPKDAPFPMTFYPTPGLKLQFTPATPAPARAVYFASNDQLYYVVGSAVYSIAPNAVGTLLGNLTTRAGPVSMKDNGSTLVIVDGTVSAFKITLSTNAFAPYGDVNFLGSDRVDFLDGFYLFNQPNTRNFYSSLLNTTTIDPTYVAAKAASPDNLRGVVVNNRLAYLLGERASEIWGNAGSANFPFQAIPGAFIRHGVASVYSIALHDTMIFAVMQDPEGKGIVVSIEGYSAKRISQPAIEAALAGYSTLSDAIGFTYMQSGHAFYVVSFPTADKTWTYDISNEKWHERAWTDANGVEHRWRVACATSAYDQILGGDWENGKLYSLELEQYNDFGGAIVRRKGFPHLAANGRLMVYEQFQAEMEVGNTPNGVDNSVSLRFSPTRGKSWSQPLARALGPTGDFLRVPQWRGLGQARDMVFELFWGMDVKTALSGAYCSVSPTDG